MMSLNVGFVSTRFSGIDGVSLEAAKWSEVIENLGHRCYWFAGESNRSETVTYLEKRAHFKTGLNQRINDCVFQKIKNGCNVAPDILEEKRALQEALAAFLGAFKIDLLIVENALSIPMQLPLGFALIDVISRSGIPTIAHHHDFLWERSRFHLNGYQNIVHKAFPPRLPSVRHVVINSLAQEELRKRKGISSRLIPNVMDFSNPPKINRKRVIQLREAIGVGADDIMVLQPTRLVARKGVGAAIDIIAGLKNPRCKLIVSHSLDDEGLDYYRWITATCKKRGIDIRFIHDRVADPITNRFDRADKFSLWEVYAAADLVTYPSSWEGFGNGFLEAIYLKKPIVLNRYKIFVTDIEPKGFDVITFDDRITAETIERIRRLLSDETRRKQMVESNFKAAGRHFSYDLLKAQLSRLLSCPEAA
jgi:glycosyltransferase involved in cell wall biosynthesis